MFTNFTLISRNTRSHTKRIYIYINSDILIFHYKKFLIEYSYKLHYFMVNVTQLINSNIFSVLLY